MIPTARTPALSRCLLCLCLLAASLAAPAPAVADEGAAAPPSAPSLPWVSGWPAGAAASRASGRLIFLYVGRHNPPCPACKRLEKEVFGKPEAAKLGEKFVLVRILGGEDATPEVTAFLERYEVEAYPTLLVMTSDGARVAEIQTFSEQGGLGIEDLLKQMDAAAARDAEFVKTRAELAGKPGLEPAVQLSMLLMERHEFEAARDVHLKVLALEPRMENYGMLAAIYARTGQREEERKTLKTMIEKFPSNPERIEWRIRVASMDLPSQVRTQAEFKALITQHEGVLVTLLKAVEAEGSLSDQSELHVRLANYAGQRSDPAGMKAHLQWIVDHDGKGKRAPHALLALARAAYDESDLDTAIAGLKRIVSEYASSPAAEEATKILPQLEAEKKEQTPPAGDPPK